MEIANQPGNLTQWGPSGNWNSVAISSSDGTTLAAVESGGQIWVSKDSGGSWSAKESNRDWRSVAVSADGTKLVAAVDGGSIYVSSNSGDTWTTGTAVTLGDSICDLAIAGVADGTAEKPYLIGTAEELAEINDCNDGAAYSYYRQTADIDLTPTSDGSQDGWNDTRMYYMHPYYNQYSSGGWVPIGDSANSSTLFSRHVSFKGSYDGNFKAITGLTINRDNRDQGLFGSTEGAEIKNLTVGSDTKVAAGSITVKYLGQVGVVTGSAGSSSFNNIHVKNVDISGNGNYFGGIAGDVHNSNATNVSYSGNISSLDGSLSQAGGIFGEADYSVTNKASVQGNITCDNSAEGWISGNNCGGVVGYNGNGSIIKVKFTGDVTGSNFAGGIVGESYKSALDSAEFNGHVYGSYGIGNTVHAGQVGGIAGFWYGGGMTNAVSNGDVIIDTSSSAEYADYIGGIAGLAQQGSISSVRANGNVSIIGTDSRDGSTASIGGAVGSLSKSSLSDAKVNGNISVVDGQNIGGIVGSADQGALVTRSSFSGAVTVNIANTESPGVNVGGAIGIAFDGAQLASTSVSKDASITATLASTLATGVGGLIGSAQSGVVITDSYNRAPVVGYGAGGIVGYAADHALSVYCSFNTGTVTANAESENKDIFSNGYWKEGLTLSNAFDTQTTGAATSGTGVVGRTTADMKTKSTFETLGFDFSSASPVWAIKASVNDGYPYLVETKLETAPVVAPVVDPIVVPVVTPPAVVTGVGFEVFTLNKFSPGSAKISKANKAKLFAYAKKLKAGQYSLVRVRAYTKTKNTSLSNKRAKAVAKLLKKYGVMVVIDYESVTKGSKGLNNQVRLIAKKK